jgi:hypothetical protein
MVAPLITRISSAQVIGQQVEPEIEQEKKCTA